MLKEQKIFAIFTQRPLTRIRVKWIEHVDQTAVSGEPVLFVGQIVVAEHLLVRDSRF